MERIEESINTITRILKTNKSRHIVGIRALPGIGMRLD